MLRDRELRIPSLAINHEGHEEHEENLYKYFVNIVVLVVNPFVNLERRTSYEIA
jgi:hypothetical protein